MTVSDWGSHGALGGVMRPGPGYVQARSPNTAGPYIHPAHGGPSPAAVPRRQAQPGHPAGHRAQAGPVGYGGQAGSGGHDGYAAPPAYGSAPAPGDAGPAAPGAAGLFNIVGAVVSVALVVGLGVWGYRLAVRDVTEVPVVRALAGPMRIQPEDPGGAVAPHQGLAVNDVAALGASGGPVDQVVLAPPVATLAPEDVPARPEGEVTAADSRPATMPMPSTGGEIDADAAVAEALGLIDLPGDEPPLGAPADPSADAPADGALEVIPESVPGVSRSPRPMPRPVGLVSLPTLAAPTRVYDVAASATTPPPARPGETVAPAAPAVVLGHEVDPAAIDAGARLVQLGAYESAEAARAQWEAIAGQNPELFHNRNWTIEQGESGGRTFYRLRAIGFDGLSDARGFCAALVAAQGSCVPVVDG